MADTELKYWNCPCPFLQEHCEDASAGDASNVKGDTLTDRNVLEGKTNEAVNIST
jgi:hypothetical protein